MKTIYVSASESELNKYGIRKNELKLSELVELINRELIRQTLAKSIELAEKYSLSNLTMGEISKEVKATRNAKNNH
ncbi:MAG: hypothetical protein ACK514_17835 [Bacteroidota bacterium]|jgi:hypothetical protein|nr:hypothetical protein [Cytophagales bacterium]MCE2957444.1 hypothetical protein [Flammeovirgaceae bacterium]MCZ8071426.1 hypothetical protein [Cytophagales bacterium]